MVLWSPEARKELRHLVDRIIRQSGGYPVRLLKYWRRFISFSIARAEMDMYFTAYESVIHGTISRTEGRRFQQYRLR